MMPDQERLKELPILAVDDEESNVLLLRMTLEQAGYVNVHTTTDPLQVPTTFVQIDPRLVLLDLHMPGMDGFELMERLGGLRERGRGVPFLVLTGDATGDAKRRALSLGARDFLTKPIDQVELLLRVSNVLQVQDLQDQLFAENLSLEDQVAERTSDLEQARLEILDRLALAAEYRDDETQEHAWRIGRTCGLLAMALDLPEREVELIGRAAPLHDIGKIGVPDSILLKQGKLTAAEFELMKTHATIGAEILSGSCSPLLLMAESIALSHHEHWDGCGYPAGLRGEEIPIEGRIVAVADVFDALMHERPYKPAWPLQEAVEEILRQAGRHFDPKVVEAFAKFDHARLLARVRESDPPLAAQPEKPQARMPGGAETLALHRARAPRASAHLARASGR
jgi:response regulator RpfG family c-di-GMP phosphodiesterase